MSLRAASAAALAVILSVPLLGLVVVEPASAAPARKPASFRIASFNVLGSNHTVNSRTWKPGKKRAKLARHWLEDEHITVAGLQEAQVDQLKVLTRKKWDAYPDPHNATNDRTAQSVIWRRSRWRMVEAHDFTIPFNVGQRRRQPVVLLRHRKTGRQIWVISMHMTAGGGEAGVKERKVGTRRLIKEVERLRKTRVPVFVTGDMNDHRKLFCKVTRHTHLHAASGGSHDGRCVTPYPMRVDWLFGSPAVRWNDFRFADGGVLDKITDHTVPVAVSRLG